VISYTVSIPAVLHFNGDKNFKYQNWNTFTDLIEYDREKVNAGVVELEVGTATYMEICSEIDTDWKY
jgi:hypothetical protein